MYKVNQKLALITGGAMGIGLATAKRLLKAGAHVIILDINQKDEVGQLADSLNKMIGSMRDRAKLANQISDGDLTVQVKALSEED